MLAIGSDHVALDFKKQIMKFLEENAIPYYDFGCFSYESTDYPIYGEKVARAVADRHYSSGLLFCGTGVGISLAANKVAGIRAVVCSDCYTAKLAKEHNNANILALGSRVVGVELAKMIIDTWLKAVFQSGRHAARITMLEDIERRNRSEQL